MSFKVLAIMTMFLGMGVWLSLNNPDEKVYEKYQDRMLLDAARKAGEHGGTTQQSVIQKLVESKDSLFFKSLIRSQTSRQDLVLFSIFETNIFSSKLVVVGIGGQFFPLTDPVETLQAIEKSVISPKL